MEPDQQTVSEYVPEVNNDEIIDLFVVYLQKMTSLFLDYDAASFESVVGSKAGRSLLRQYLTNPQQTYFFVSIDADEKVNIAGEFDSLQPGKVVMIIKKNDILNEERSKAETLNNAFHFIHMGEFGKEFDPIMITRNCLKFGFDPMLKSVVSDKVPSGKYVSEKEFADILQKKFDDIDLLLIQSNALNEIPDVQLISDKEISAAIAKWGSQPGIPAPENMPEEVLRNESIISLQETVSKWYQLSRILLKHSNETNFESITAEVEYWGKYLNALYNLKKQIEQKEVTLSLEILRFKKKLTKNDLIQELDLNQKIASVESFVKIMKEIPISSLTNAKDLGMVAEAMLRIFESSKKLFGNPEYPFEKCIKFLEVFSQDLTNCLITIFQSLNVLKMDFKEFEELSNQVKVKIVNIWNTQISTIKDFFNTNNTLDRNRFSSIVYKMKHTRFYDRIKLLFQCREEYESMKKNIKDINRKEEQNTEGGKPIDFLNEDDIRLTFERNFNSSLNLFDLSPKEEAAINNAKKKYNNEIEFQVKEIITKIRDLLGSSKNYNEMYKIFSKFSTLIKMPQVKSAVREYQESLLSKIQENTYDLFVRYKKKFETSGGMDIARHYGIPPLSGGHIWSEQLVKHLKENTTHVESILGDKLNSSARGQEFQKLVENFTSKREKENPLEKFEKQEFEFDGKLLTLEQIPRTGHFKLQVNFSPETKTMVEEFRNLIKQKKTVNFSLTKKYYFRKNAWPVYVNALKLMETVKIWNFIIPRVDDNLTKLLATQLKKVYSEVEKGFKLEWKTKDSVDSEHQTYFTNFTDSVIRLEEEVDYLTEKISIIEEVLSKLSSSENSFEFYEKSIKQIQEVIDQLLLKDFTNIDYFVNEINSRIEKILVKKLSDTLVLWTDEFLKFKVSPASKNKNKLVESSTHHEIHVKGKQVSITPSVQNARSYWLHHLLSQINFITTQKCIRVDVYTQIASAEKKETTFSYIVQKIPTAILHGAYSALNETVREAEEYAKTWISYQALWDIDINYLYKTLGNNLNSWMGVLSEMRQGRNTFDNSQFEKNFGPIVIDYKNVQMKINYMYDNLQQSILDEFARNFVDETKKFFETINTMRSKLEKLNFASPKEMVENISSINMCKENLDSWESSISTFADNEKMLMANKHRFPDGYKNVSAIQKEWSRFKQVYQSKSNMFEGNNQEVQNMILKEEEGLMEKVKQVESLWNDKKPFGADLNPKEALEVLNQLENTIKDNKDSIIKLNQAKEMLKLPPIEMDLINIITEDSAMLKELWSEVDKIWSQLDGLFDALFITSNSVAFTKSLDAISESLNDVSPKFRNHEIVVGKRKEISKLKKKNKIIREIKTEAIKENHLIEIFKRMKIEKSPNEIKIGELMNRDIEAMEKSIMEIVNSAQGELVLETMINKIKEFWSTEQFQTSKYQSKCLLIKSWDELMNKTDEDMSQLNSMRLSQHYKSFESDIKSWNEKITNLGAVLSSWMDVQRKWVYLEGIFLGSSDIKQQLPAEYDRFMNVDREFVQIMKKMESKMRVLETVTSIPNLLKTLEYLSDTLTKIQKSLNEYLETQRQAFARFYFVGDEDLLEIIGNAKEITNVQKYFNKMFAGINSIDNEDKNLLKGMFSKEAEIVPFDKPFKISDFSKINEWLSEMERQMQTSLQTQFELTLTDWKDANSSNMRALIEKYPTQSILLAFQTFWTFLVEDHILNKKDMVDVEKKMIGFLAFMAEEVLTNLKKLTRKRYEQMITELVHKRDVTRKMGFYKDMDIKDFKWCYYMRYYLEAGESDRQKRVKVRMGNSEFVYGHEYLGITDKLVQTPLTDKCYFTLTQAMHLRMGGAPFGPAGTGKTESVKALGCNLGRFVLVFNCDENFNDNAMGRIFIGLCQVGAWGCFDEFNRLEEKILSAVSQQILVIQTGLREKRKTINLKERIVNLSPNMGAFVTMNPGYAGRSNLPENLKQLFRQMAMIKPDSVLIAQVMLFSQGFKSAEELSGKVVALFELCADQLSSQPHYDFGLRSLKSVLNSAGNLKRKILSEGAGEEAHSQEEEQKIILRSFSDTVVPKLISEDNPLLKSLIIGVFPNSNVPPITDPELLGFLKEECDARFLLSTNEAFIEKVLQLNQILKLAHGVMLVGPTGCGKTAAWKALLASLNKLEKAKGEFYIIDPKAISKDELYGKLDNTTMEWTDGIFTYILRRIADNQRGEKDRRQWIIFDGDVDPEWAENLNSVLDDNKLLTLPNGDRLSIQPNIRMLFEVESLKYATLATVSRCGMVWFSEDILTSSDIYHHYLMRLKEENYDLLVKAETTEVSSAAPTREKCVEMIWPLFFREGAKSVVDTALELAEKENHVMEFTRIRVLEALFALVRKGIDNVIEYDEAKFGNYMMDLSTVAKYMLNWTIFAVNWAFVGDLKLSERSDYFTKLRGALTELPEKLVFPAIDDNLTLIDYEVRLEDGEWSLWKNKVVTVDISQEKVTSAEMIISTVDTLRHQEVLCSWLLEHRPFLICGPPGSGKTMTLMSTLKNLPDFEMIFVNFSSSTTPGLIQKQFEHYCEYTKSAGGVTLHPRSINKWLVVFCDEINLPDEDKYGTQSVITFLRQLTEQHGFWKCSGADKLWVTLDRIQFVGACNPPTDAGRHPLANRFLRHCPLILVDFPGYDSLVQIYGTFNRAMTKRTPSLKPYAEALTSAMVEYYTQSQKRFTSDQQPHYIYSPRELTRWKYAINEAWDTLSSLEDLVRLWAHEALRLFEDRLVTEDEKRWCQEKVDEIAYRFFPTVDQTCLARPILYSTYLTKAYQSCKLDDLREYVLQKLKAFNEEEYDVQLVIFDEVLEHISKIDRVLRQPIGHMLLVGASGVGKTTLSRFVSWINGLKVFQIKAGRNYSLSNFDDDLRAVMKRAGCRLEKITFIFDESNVISVAFLERMNALLASGEIPGLFEGEEYHSLINAYKEANGNKGRETEEEIYKAFTKNVQRNLHVVFTMNPANPDFSNRAASSPAIFNRCVIDWFGDWPEEALNRVALELTAGVEFEPGIEHQVIVDLIVKIHKSVKTLNDKLQSSAKKFNYMTPRDYLDFIRHFITLTKEKRELLKEEEGHLKKGLQSIRITEETVAKLKKDLDVKNAVNKENSAKADEDYKRIVDEQKKVNAAIEEAKKLKEAIEVKQVEINKRKGKVEDDLRDVEPKRKAAEEQLKGIKDSQLTEMRSYSVPPKNVVHTLNLVFKVLENGKNLEWAAIKSDMAKPGFISRVMKFDVSTVKASVRKEIRPAIDELDPEVIKKSSGAAAPLAYWLKAQMDYADIKDTLAPMEEEVANLTKENEKKEQEMVETENKIKEMETRIKVLQEDYAVLLSKIEEFKRELEVVGSQIEKSEALMASLNTEKTRWESSLKDFTFHFQTLTGDVLLSAAFLTYLGFFDQFYRQTLLKKWKSFVTLSKVPFKKDISIIEYLTSPSERIIWQSKGLPADDLCVQNAIILKRYNRYPLIIDPAGQAIDFVINLYSDGERKLSRTSFMDEGFMKQLETSLRFGIPILIQDVEKIEPILNSVLNKETTKQGGRTIIRLGDQTVDFNADFKLFMITRNSEARFTPDLCSRVTFVNFTVTKSSLENQFINIYLKHERPDVEQKRINLLKLQGEFIVKLRELEDQLLNELAKSEGSNILENEEMIQTLANIKQQATTIQAEKEQSDVVLEEIGQVLDQYKPVSVISSRLYFILLSLASIKPMYQFSLKYYMKVLLKLLSSNKNLIQVPLDRPDERLKVIETELFLRVYEKINNSVHEADKIILAARFAQVKIDTLYGKALGEFLGVLFKPVILIETTLPNDFLKGTLTKQQLTKIEDLSQRPGFGGLIDSMRRKADAWVEIIKSPSANSLASVKPFMNLGELSVEFPEGSSQHLIAECITDLIIINIVKPQKADLKLNELIEIVLGKEFMTLWRYDLKIVVEEDADGKSPILFASAPGFDPSSRIYDLAKEMGKRYEDVAIGSEEGFIKADQVFNQALKDGSWVIFKNVHLAVTWLKDIEQQLYKSSTHKDFRLFLLMEFSDKIPATLLRQSVKFIFELPDGVKASVSRTYNTFAPEKRIDRAPAERSRLHFILAWIHGVIMERLRYTPTGWSKKYEFSEADFKCAMDVLDEFIDLQGNRDHIALDAIPFDALRSVISENIYGGKIDNEYDLKILRSVVDQYLTPDSFDPKKPLIKDKNQVITNPEATKFAEFKSWIEGLQATESPVWAGLPAQADDLLKIERIEGTLAQLTLIQDGNDEEIGLDEDEKGRDAAPTKLAWMTELIERTKTYLDILPTSLDKPERNEELILNPLFRFIEREATLASNLLETVRKVLKDVLDMAEGRTLPQQETKKIAQNIYQNEIPKFWRKYTIPDSLQLSVWIKDFKSRVEQLTSLQKMKDWQTKGVNLGEFLFPEAFLTASRQYVAQSNKVSMDELQLQISLTNDKEVDTNSFLVKNIWMEGVKWSNTGFEITDDMLNHLKNIKFTWLKCKASDVKQIKAGEIFVPLYLNSGRKNLITSIKVPIQNPEVTEKQLYQRGLALIAWKI